LYLTAYYQNHRSLLGKIRLASIILLLGGVFESFGQQIKPTQLPDTANSNLVIIDKADKVEKTEGIEQQEVLILTGNVLMHQDSLFMQCDSARKEANNLVAVGNVLLQQWDSLNVFAQSLEYFGDTKDAFLKDSVVMQSKDQKLFTDVLMYNTETKVATYDQGATLTNDTVFLYSRKGTFYVATDQVFFKDSVYVQSEDFELFADTLLYNTKEQKAYFLGPTLINLASGSKVYCEGGYFDMVNKKALFTQQAQYVDEDQLANADSIFYDGDLKKVTMIGQASLTEPGKEATADTIIYLENENEMNLLGHAYFQDSIRTMRSASLNYNAETDKLVSNTRSSIDNPPQFLEADAIDFDNKTGVGVALGNIIWKDTAAHYTILCEQAQYLDSSSYLKAYGGRPLLINQIDEDSFLLSADTLVSYEEVIDSDSIRKFQAYHDVKIFKSDLQAICDSLSYSSQDSIFRLYDDPVIWSDTSQFEADSVSIQLADNKIDQIYLNKNAFIINSADQILYNQMKGKEITAYFKEGEIDKMLIKGNASSIYYVLDDFKAYIGVNETLCSSMLLRFASNTVGEISFYDSPKATFHPIQDADTESLKLEGFNWRDDERPKSKLELSTFIVE
jgi:lipopolysaccharide export system protein LptA